MSTVNPKPMRRPEPVAQDSDKKLKELILLVATQSEGDKPFGVTKLNKLLFYMDFLSYVRFGESITGQEYQKLPQGPAPRRVVPVMKEMQRNREIGIRDNDYYGKNQKRTFALRSADISVFDGGQLELVHEIIKQLWGRSATEVSDLSHRFVGWKIAQMGETIPYSVALIGERKPTPHERRIGQMLDATAKRLKGECAAVAA